MLRLLGAVFVSAAAAWTGFQAAAALRERARALEDMSAGLALLEQELELGGLPLPQLMASLEGRCAGPARALFQGCVQGLEALDQESFSQLWRRLTASQTELGREGQDCLAPLGEVLGRCGGSRQCQTLRAVRARLDACAARNREEFRRQGRVYRALGLSGGVFLVLLLL
ncbi:MAG: stage III sporulation protein AB [Lawsonibacter sp.]|nr:stage III sporulation protein AB [Lawsonibacter sp.]